MAKWINNMEKEFQGIKGRPETDIQLVLIRATLKKVSHIGKHKTMMAYTNSGFKKSRLSITD